MNKRFKQILMLVFAVALLLPQFGVAQKASAAGSPGSTNGNYVLKVQTTGGNQWDGAQIDTGAMNLVDGTTYTFSFDLYTPDQDVEGIVLQTNKSYTWIKDTGALSAVSPAWASYTGDLAYSSTKDSGALIQFVKKGGATEAKNITYYIDNFVVKDASDAVVFEADFDDQTLGSFTQSGDATLSTVVPDYFLKIQTTGGNQWDGAQIDTSGWNLVDGTTYTFSFDLYTPDQDVEGIVLQTNKSYTWIKDTGALSAANPAWSSYSGDLAYTKDSGALIQFVKKGGATEAKNITYYIDNFVVKDASDAVVFEADFDDQTLGSFTQSGDATLTTVLSITPTTPTTPTEPSDEVVVAFNLQDEPHLDKLGDWGGTDYLQRAGGPTLKQKPNDDGTVSLDLSQRKNSYDGVDVKYSSIGLAKGADVNVKLAGHIPADVTIPSDAIIVLQYADGAEIKSVKATTNFTLSYEGVWDASANLRVTASAGLPNFVIDSLIVEVKGGKKMPLLPKESRVPGLVLSNKSSTSATIILGTDNTVWPYATSSTGYAAAFTPEKDAKYRLTFNVTSTDATGFRVRWFNDDGYNSNIPADTAVVNDNKYKANETATKVPAYFENTIAKGETKDYTVEFIMDGSIVPGGLVGNIGIRGQQGSPAFAFNSIKVAKVTDDGEQVLLQWSNKSGQIVPDDYPWPKSNWNLNLPSLKDAYSNYFLIGNILGWGGNADATPWGQENDSADSALREQDIIDQTAAMFKSQYNVVTAENIMKPENISKAKGDYNYTVADKLVNWAEANNIPVHGHTLVWHSQSPAWLNKDSAANRTAAKANLESYIKEVAGHFAGKVISWDVVNEAFSDNTSNFKNKDWTTGLRTTDSPWYVAYATGADPSKGESGSDYIYDAFVFSRLADPNAKLYYNDYNETFKYEQIALMAESLNEKWEKDSRNTDKARKLVEGIGMQSHFWVGQEPVVDEVLVRKTIQRFVDAGLDISVSELDIPFADNQGYHLTDAQQEQQAELYGKLFEIYKDYADNIDRVTFWGKNDIQSWRGSGMPLLFDNSYRPKAAFWTVIGLDAPTSTISPATVTFYTNSQADAKVNITLNGNTLSQIRKGNVALVEGKDYSVAAASANGTQVVTINKSYLATLSNNDVLTFEFSAGSTSDLKITVTRYTSSDNSGSAGPGAGAGSGSGSNSGSESNSGSKEQTPTPEKPLLDSKLVDAAQLKAAVQKALQANKAVNFSDVPATHWSAKAVQIASQIGLIEGKPDGTFHGSENVTRAEFATMIVRALGLATTGADGSFSDTNGHWADAYIRALHRAGIVNGTGKGAFNPDQEITRAEMAAILARILNMSAANGTKFSDINGNWAADYINQLSQAGIVDGVGNGKFAPNATATREQSVAIIMRMLNIVLDLELKL